MSAPADRPAEQRPVWRTIETEDGKGQYPFCPKCDHAATETVEQPWADYPITTWACPRCGWEYVTF